MGTVEIVWFEEGDRMVMVAEEHAARIRNIRKVIDKLKIDRMCRMCGEREKGDGSSYSF